MAFGSYKDVDNWLAAPGRTIGTLRAAVQSGQMAGENARWAKAWLVQYDELAAPAQAERELQLLARSATAAESQARWSRAAVGISVAALMISAWPYIAKLWE
ncbi:hypothetical protein J2W35_003236 [Variovorax boronicumulans]|uniref:hypothetical protein n=1 Tax=Variovorax boronicumulans TaxID=436515 RepID=UPI0027894835|nr:hypothetical protein [Variovorax boronicumulans]MDQ0082877.1 hypothetical protein [Variovorax boronicumulans]